MGDAATCRRDPGSTARLEGRGAAAEGRNPVPPGWNRLRGVFPGIRRGLLDRAETRLAAGVPHFGHRGKSLNPGALIATVVKRRKCTNTSSQHFKGGGGGRGYTNVPVLWSWFSLSRNQPGLASLSSWPKNKKQTKIVGVFDTSPHANSSVHLKTFASPLPQPLPPRRLRGKLLPVVRLPLPSSSLSPPGTALPP